MVTPSKPLCRFPSVTLFNPYIWPLFVTPFTFHLKNVTLFNKNCQNESKASRFSIYFLKKVTRFSKNRENFVKASRFSII